MKKKKKKENKAAGWKRRQREGNQARRGTKRDGPPRRVLGWEQGWTPEGRRATASPEERQGCLAARCSLTKVGSPGGTDERTAGNIYSAPGTERNVQGGGISFDPTAARCAVFH